jgi:hypothetical protein
MYLIPRNISNRFEFFPGWGWMELFLLLAGLGIGGLLFMLFGLVTSGPVRVIPIMLFGFLGFIAGQPIMNDTKLIEVAISLYKYQQSQKLYLYQKGGL